MIVIDSFPQLSEEWHIERLGNPGSSHFDEILTNVRGLPSKSATGYAMQLAGEKVAGKAEDHYISKDMERGIEREPHARDVFAWETDLNIREVALCYPDEQKKYHCSPDGLCDDGGGLEIKCPKMKTHVKYLLDNKFPKADYNAQVQGSLLVTGLSHWWFMSYYPDLKPLIIKILPDEEYIKKLKAELNKFCLELPQMIQKVKNG